MAGFGQLATEHGSGFIGYDQAHTVEGNSLSNPYLRMNLSNRGGVCLGLSMGFLLYSKRFFYQQPMIWIDRFMTDSRAAWQSGGNFHGLSDLQTFVGSVMEDQRQLGKLAARTKPLEDGMWHVSLKFRQSNVISWGGGDIIDLISPHISEYQADAYWLLGVHTRTGGHAMAIRSMIHPNTGYRLLAFFEPNFGVVQFQGVTCLKSLEKFLDGLASGDDGSPYLGRNAELYRFS